MPDWLVLTGGASSRLGQDKASTRLSSGETLLERSIAAITGVDPDATIIEVGRDRLGGPAAAVAAAVPDCSAHLVGVVAVDMPFIRNALAALLAEADDSERNVVDAWVPVDASGRRQWLCALYRRAALLQRADSRDWVNRPFHDFVAGLTTREITVHESISLLDIDTPADLRHADSMTRERGKDGAHG